MNRDLEVEVLEKRGHAFARYADDCNVYVRSRRAGERVMEALRGLYARLRLRINEAKSAVARPWDRKFLGFSFWVAPGRVVKRRVAAKAAYVAANTRRWWKNASMLIHIALPTKYFDELGVPRLAR